MEAALRAVLRRRLALLSILLVVGAVTGAAITALGAEQAMPGTSYQYISVVKAQQTGQSSDQRMRQLAQFEGLAKNLTAIANEDERTQVLLAGKTYTVVGIAILKDPPPPPLSIDTIALFLKVEANYYQINIDSQQKKVISETQCTVYGSADNAGTVVVTP